MLPAWIEEVAKEPAASRVDFMPRLIEALSIAWVALAKISHKNRFPSGNPSDVVEHAMRRIEELGK